MREEKTLSELLYDAASASLDDEIEIENEVFGNSDAHSGKNSESEFFSEVISDTYSKIDTNLKTEKPFDTEQAPIEIEQYSADDVDMINDVENTEDVEDIDEITEEIENTDIYKSAEEMTDEIIALTARLDEQFKKNTEKTAEIEKEKKSVYTVGAVSASLSLVLAGVALIYGFQMPEWFLSLFRYSPFILIFLGLEIIINIIIRKSFALKFDIFGFALSAGVIILTGIISSVFLGFSNSELIKEKIEKRLENDVNRTITNEFMLSEIPAGNIESDVFIYGEDLFSYDGIYNIKENDTVDIRIYFNSPPATIIDFAENCAQSLKILCSEDYFQASLGTVEFISEDKNNSMRVKLNKTLQSSLQPTEIARLTEYFVENVDTDIGDLVFIED